MSDPKYDPPSEAAIAHARELLPLLIESKYAALVPPNTKDKKFDVHFQLCCTALRFGETFERLSKQERQRVEEHVSTGGSRSDGSPF